MNHPYWLKQTGQKPLFPELEWEAPERRDQRGKLTIIGGTKLGFASVAGAYKEATEAGAGYVRVVVPDALKPVLNSGIEDVLFSSSNTSGGFSKEAEADMKAAASWADMMLLPGDNGRNSETAITFEHLLSVVDTPCTITRDAIDLLKSNPSLLIERGQNTLVLSFAQLQKLLQSVYFPRGIVFSMHLNQLVEVLHKVTLSYPAMLVTYHSDHLVIAHDGRVATQAFDKPMLIWRGSVATLLAVKLMQYPSKQFEVAAHAVYSEAL